MATSAVDLNNLPSYNEVVGYNPNVTDQSNMSMANALMLQRKQDDILGISQDNTAFNRDQAETANALTAQWYNQSMDYNALEAAKNRAWQQEMSNTAHQREVQDLIKAGLNPVLSASGGNGAAVGSGASASVQAPNATKASADTSGATALVSLLGHSLDAMTKVAQTNTNALTNLAVADKYNQMSKYLGEFSGANQRDIANIYGEYGIRQAATSGMYNLNAAATNAGAMMAAAATAADAARYGYDVSERNNIRTTNVNERNNIRDNKQSNINNARNNRTSRGNAWIQAGGNVVGDVVNSLSKFISPYTPFFLQ